MNENHYWQDVAEKDAPKIKLEGEFPKGTFDLLNAEKSRRDFLGLLGFSFAAAPFLASCHRAPVRKALAYLNRDDNSAPGVASWYASTCAGCHAACGIVVKTREGRPIKIEGNTLSPISKGGVCAAGQASVLSLYDSSRFMNPMKDGKECSWEVIDAELGVKLGSSVKTVLVTGPINSPSSLKAIRQFANKFKNVEHVVYEPVSYRAISLSHQYTHGIENLPEYDLSNADLVVGFHADFLGTWLNPVGYTKQYSARRDLTVNQSMLRHIQFESNMSLTGSNADLRVPIAAHEEVQLLAELTRLIAQETGANDIAASLASVQPLPGLRKRWARPRKNFWRIKASLSFFPVRRMWAFRCS